MLSCALLLVFTHLKYLVFLGQNQMWCMPTALKKLESGLYNLQFDQGKAVLAGFLKGQGRAVKGTYAVQNVVLQVSPTSAWLLAPASRPELTPQILHLYLLETAIIKKSFCVQHAKALQSLRSKV